MDVATAPQGSSARTDSARRRIMDVAATRFLAQGYEAASLRDIASDVGIKAGSLYYHFASKEALLTAVLQQGIDVMEAAFDQAAADTDGAGPRRRLAAHVRAHLSALFEHGPYTAVHVTTFRTAPADVRRTIVPVRDAYEARWAALLDELRAIGAIRSTADTRLARLALFGAMNWSVEWFDPSRGNLDEFAAEITEQLWNGSRRMRRIHSKIDTRSDRFAVNFDHNVDEVLQLRERQQYAIDGGPGRDRSIDRHLSRGKVMVRDRIDMVIDEGTAFMELSPLAAWGQYDDQVPGAGIVTGIGLVHGVPWMFIANDATVKGGSLVPMAIKKHVRAQDIALENDLGVIYLVDSGGAFLPLQDEIFPDKDHFGGSFYRQARLSAAGLPQLSVVLGGCTAGGAYVPALSDEVIMVQGIGRIFLGGPPIVKAALGEIIEPDDLGGAELHTYTSGVSDYLARTEQEAYGKLREICETTSRRRIDERQDWFDWLPGERATGRRHRGAVRGDLGRRPDPVRGDRRHRPARRRLTLPRVQARLGRVDRHRLRPDPRPPGRRPRQQRHHLLRGGAEGDPLHRAVRAAPRPAGLPAEHHRLHGRPGVRGRRHRQARGEDGGCCRQRHRTQVHGADRRLVRCRQLRHVRPEASSPASCSPGPTRASPRCRPTPPRRCSSTSASPDSRRTRPPTNTSPSSVPRCANSTRPSRTPTSRPAGSGTTASSSRRRRATCSACASRSPPAKTSPPPAAASCTGCDGRVVSDTERPPGGGVTDRSFGV